MHGLKVRATQRRVDPGFTLIELTVVLAVIVTLALILTPSVANLINDSRVTRARTDTQAIGTAIVAFYRDTGFFPQWAVSQAGGPGMTQMRLQLLVSSGAIPLEESPSLWTTGQAGGLGDQLQVNSPGYAMRSVTAQFGWNGPYLSSEVRSDPWGNRYVVNIGLIDTSPGAMSASGAVKSAVFVLSAGPNGTIETPFAQPLTSAAAGGDDITFRIQ
jgi:prepilin-type N-terminal cleavage/methylation domain-containing protein